MIHSIETLTIENWVKKVSRKNSNMISGYVTEINHLFLCINRSRTFQLRFFLRRGFFHKSNHRNQINLAKLENAIKFFRNCFIKFEWLVKGDANTTTTLWFQVENLNYVLLAVTRTFTIVKTNRKKVWLVHWIVTNK